MTSTFNIVSGSNDTVPTNLIDATSGNQTCVLRKASEVAFQKIRFVKEDSSANTVTILPYGTSEVWTLNFDTSASGTFTLTFNPAGAGAQTTGTIAYNASAATIQTALEALSNIAASGDVTCTGGPVGTDTVTITFSGAYLRTDLGAAALTIDATSLVSGDVTLTRYVAGIDGDTVGGTTSIVLATQGDAITLMSDGVSDQVVIDSSIAGAGSGDAIKADGLSQFAASTSADLRGVISDETGSGALVFGTGPTLSSPRINTMLTNSGATRRTLAAEPVTPVNYFVDTISAAGDPVTTGAAGSDSNIDFAIAPKGTGVVALQGGVSEGSATSSAYLRGGPGSLHRKVKKIGSMTDATFTDLFTITVPNAAHSAALFVRAVGALGDSDSTAADEFIVAIARQSGEDTITGGDIIVTSVAQPRATGAQTIVMAFQLSGLTGAIGATQTFTLQGKITKGGGSSANHFMTCVAELLNQNASGVTFT